MAMHVASKRFGSADWSTTRDLKKAGLLNNGGLHHGFTFEKKPLQIGFHADTPSLILGPAGTRKLTSQIAYQTLQAETTVFLDPKGEIAAISNLNIDFEHYYFNPYGLHASAPWFIPANHRFNSLEIIDPDSATFFEDCLTVAMNLTSKPSGGGGTSEHFWDKAVSTVTGLIMYGKEHSPHFSLPDLFNLIGDIQGGGEADYFSTLHKPRMRESRFSVVRQLADELEVKIEKGGAEFTGILSTINRSLKVLGSPALQMTLSGPSTINFKDFLKPEKVRKLFIMIPAHLLEVCGPIVRCMIAALTIEQQRNPLCRVHFCLDEAGQVGKGGFEVLPRMYSYGRSSQARVSAYYQNYSQGIASLGKDDFDTIVSNAQSKLILGVGSKHSAQFVIDNILGQSTYRYLSKAKYDEASFKRTQAITQALSGQDFSQSLLEIARQDDAMHTPDSVARPLMTTEELMDMEPHMGILFINGLGIKPYRYLKWPYFLNPWVAHKFLPNPYHLPHDRIVIPARFGRTRNVKIISEAVPEEIAHLPQYASGYWSYPEGFCPLKTKRSRWFKR